MRPEPRPAAAEIAAELEASRQRWRASLHVEGVPTPVELDFLTIMKMPERAAERRRWLALRLASVEGGWLDVRRPDGSGLHVRCAYVIGVADVRGPIVRSSSDWPDDEIPTL